MSIRQHHLRVVRSLRIQGVRIEHPGTHLSLPSQLRENRRTHRRGLIQINRWNLQILDRATQTLTLLNTRLAAGTGTHKTGNVQPVGTRQVAVAVVRGDQVACRLRQAPVHLTQLSVQGIKLLHDLLGAGRVLARTLRVGGGERVTNDLHARLRVRHRMPNVRVNFAVHVLAQNGLRQQVHLTAMLRSTRPQETVATAGGHLLQGAGGDRDHGAVQFVLYGALGGIRAKHEPAVAGACRNIGVTCGKNLDV